MYILTEIYALRYKLKCYKYKYGLKTSVVSDLLFKMKNINLK